MTATQTNPAQTDAASPGNAAQNYDAIVIGSGMGALAAGSLLAQLRGKRVLILERHYVLGGFTHEFGRKQKWSWDVGVHYIGDLGEGALLRRLFDRVTRGGVDWKKMPPIFEKFVYPDFTFGVSASEEQYRKDLCAQFPAEAAAIERYFEDVKTCNSWFGQHNMRSPHPFIDKARKLPDLHGCDTPDITAGDYMQRNFSDPQLRALLLSQWGDYGIPPARSAFVIHASVVAHYLGGGYYPVGGAGAIAENVKPIIEEFGGACKLSHQVEEILIEDGRAIGVRARNLIARKNQPETLEFYAPLVLSNAGAYATYHRLLPKTVEIPFREQLKKFYEKHPVVSSVTLYLGLKDDPRKLPHGFQGENHWMYASYDHDANFASGSNWIGGEGAVGGAYLSFPSLKNPEARGHTAEIIALTPFEPFAKWANSDWKRRGEDYETLKQSVQNKLLDFVEARYPGFREQIEYAELSTPLSVQHFTGHPQGSIYGMPCVRERFQSEQAPWCSPLTPLEGLYLTGSDASSPGVAGALMGAMAALANLPDGVSFIKAIKESKGKAAAG